MYLLSQLSRTSSVLSKRASHQMVKGNTGNTGRELVLLVQIVSHLGGGESGSPLPFGEREKSLQFFMENSSPNVSPTSAKAFWHLPKQGWQ